MFRHVSIQQSVLVALIINGHGNTGCHDWNGNRRAASSPQQQRQRQQRHCRVIMNSILLSSWFPFIHFRGRIQGMSYGMISYPFIHSCACFHCCHHRRRHPRQALLRQRGNENGRQKTTITTIIITTSSCFVTSYPARRECGQRVI